MHRLAKAVRFLLPERCATTSGLQGERSTPFAAARYFPLQKEHRPERPAQFGLVADQVEKVNPALVVRDAGGKPYSVRYEAVNAMLLNEFLKEHRAVQELKSTAAKREATIAQQQKEIQTLTASLKAQASQIQKVSARLDATKPATQLVDNNQ